MGVCLPVTLQRYGGLCSSVAWRAASWVYFTDIDVCDWPALRWFKLGEKNEVKWIFPPLWKLPEEQF